MPDPKKAWASTTPRLGGVPEDRPAFGDTPRSGPLGLTGRAVMGEQTSDWSHLARYAHQLDEQDKVRQKSRTVAMKQQMRAELDRQVEEQKTRKAQQKAEEQKWFQNQCEEWDQWHDMEKAKKQMEFERATVMKHAREEQVIMERQIKAAERKKKKDEDDELVEKIAIELEKENKAAEQKKQKNKEAMFKLLQESTEQARAKEVKKKKDNEAEIENMKEYNKVLDAQDDKRKKEAEVRKEKQVELSEKMKVIVAQQQATKGDLDQQLANRQKAEADARAVAALQHKEERLREMRHANQAFLFQQMAEKQDRRNADKEMKQLQAEILEAEMASYLQIEKQRSQDRRSKNVEHRLELQSQIAQRKAEPGRDAMSASELAMNKQVLSLATDLNEKQSYAPAGSSKGIPKHLSSGCPLY